MNVATGIVVSTLVALGAYHVRALRTSGVLAAIFVGTAIAAGFGMWGLFVLGFFFISSVLIGRWTNGVAQHVKDSSKTIKTSRTNVTFQPRENIMVDGVVEKGSRRDARQVLANGGVAAACAMLYVAHDHMLWVVAFSAALVAATADTWATEAGRISREKPIDIRTGHRVATGTSGAISMAGTVASVFGALICTACAYPLILYVGVDVPGVALMLIIFVSGWLGNVADTVAGAFVQVRFRCEQCGTITEQMEHCRTKTRRIQGGRLFDNDVVNGICTVSAAAIAIGLMTVIGVEI